MSTGKIVSEVLGFAGPIAERLNFEIVDLEYVKEGQNFILRAFIDKDGGITIDDCEIFSRSLEKVLDEEDPIAGAYILEVSSPGLDRPLKKDSDFYKYKGKLVDVKLFKAVDNKKEFQGALDGLCDNIVSIYDDEGKLLSFDRNSIASIRLAVIF